MIETTMICDSIAASRLSTMLWRYPKFVHQESLRHRLIYFEDQLRGDWDFSFSVSSARAIPFSKLLAEVRNSNLRANPVSYGSEQKGMSPGQELIGQDLIDAKSIWTAAALDMADYAEHMSNLGVHKSICNRLIEPFIHINCLATATELGWMNFFGLRLDKAADPTLQALAESAWRTYNESEPKLLKPNDWHIPFVDENDYISIHQDFPSYKDKIEQIIKISVARCARLSYLSFDTDKRSTIKEDLKLYNRLVGQTPIHASPAEHQATPDVMTCSCASGPIQVKCLPDTETKSCPVKWRNIDKSGNFGPGWIQYRKTLPGENLAPLPNGFRTKIGNTQK